MNILKAINASFTKFWRWIKETAWVQPLLIVGGIFAIIFSISKFQKWFSVMAVGSSSGYFTSYRISLENEGKAGFETDVDKFADTINDYSFNEYESYAELKADLDEAKVIKTYGLKYYFIIVEEDCTGCTNAEAAFNVLDKGWNTSNFRIEDNGTFTMHSVFADQSSTNDNDYELDEDKKAFTRFVKKFDDRDLWARAAGRLMDSPYRMNASVSESKYVNIENAESASWETPTIFLVDWTEAAFNAGRYGLSEVIFGFTSGTADYDRATLLQQMWNHVPQDEEKSSKDTTNPFRAEYQA